MSCDATIKLFTAKGVVILTGELLEFMRWIFVSSVVLETGSCRTSSILYEGKTGGVVRVGCGNGEYAMLFDLLGVDACHGTTGVLEWGGVWILGDTAIVGVFLDNIGEVETVADDFESIVGDLIGLAVFDLSNLGEDDKVATGVALDVVAGGLSMLLSLSSRFLALLDLFGERVEVRFVFFFASSLSNAVNRLGSIICSIGSQVLSS